MAEVVSAILVKPLGIVGVLLGTIISCTCTSLWVDPYMVYRFHFKKPLIGHFKDIFYYTIVVVFAGVVTWFLSSLVILESFWGLILKLVISAIVPNIIILICFSQTKEFKGAIKIIKGMIKNKNA